jgi:hypothetical protein
MYDLAEAQGSNIWLYMARTNSFGRHLPPPAHLYMALLIPGEDGQGLE